MTFERVIEGKNHLWAVRDLAKPKNELALLFDSWNDFGYLMEFFIENIDDLRNFFHIERISEAIEDTVDDAEQLERLILEMPYSENLDELFKPLGAADLSLRQLTREKARNWNRTGHASWLRVYAIRLEKDVFVITGGTIKLTKTMQERPHTSEQLQRLNHCRQYLLENGVFDSDSFMTLTQEDEI
ncbi:MAG: hypothetical protein J6T82_07210 [Bacteroidaceae bacterium]|nr:hypothetical protein [Bacteroidaceae bacterium]